MSFQHVLARLNMVWRPTLILLPLLVSSFCILHSSFSSGSDQDSDGMSDAWEIFFGTNPTNPADAALDYDGDGLANLAESEPVRLTDPWAYDTDHDGLSDRQDMYPISRAYVQWGAPRFTTVDVYDYPAPDWCLGAYKSGGEWICDPLGALALPSAWPATRFADATNSYAVNSAWYFASSGSNACGSLSIDLNRAILTNNLVYALHYWAQSEAEACLPEAKSGIFVDLLNTNGEVIAENLYGNLAGASNVYAVVYFEVPTALFPEAAVIHLRCGAADDLSGETAGREAEVGNMEVMVFEILVYIDEDFDGLDNEAEKMLLTSDYQVDSDGDGIGDYESFFHATNTYTNTTGHLPTIPIIDPDGDEGLDRNGIIYVDQARGNDTFTGRAPAISGNKRGPKKTIHKGIAAVDEDQAHTLVIKSGAYNENLDLRGKNLKTVIEGNVRL